MSIFLEKELAENKGLCEAELSAKLGVERKTLQAWRLRGGGPKFVKMGRCVRYFPKDIDYWMMGYASQRDLVQIKKLNPKAKLPVYSSTHAAGADISVCIDKPIVIYPGECRLIPTGLSMALPPGFGAYLIPRSGLGHKNGIVLGNLVGLIDADYRGEVFVSVWNRNKPDTPCFEINPGDRIAQMCIIETRQFDFIETDNLDDTERGAGGFESTGRG